MLGAFFVTKYVALRQCNVMKRLTIRDLNSIIKLLIKVSAFLFFEKVKLMTKKNKKVVMKMAVSRKDSKGRALHAREYEKADGRYEYKYYIGKDRRTITCSTLEELREREKEVTKDVLDGINPSKSANLKVNDVYKIWHDMKRGLKGNTLQNYTYMYEHFIMKTSLGKSRINSVNHSDVRVFYNKLIDKEKMQVNTLHMR